MKVSACLKGSLDSLGRKTVYIRIADRSKRKFHATGIKVEPKYWDKRVINHPRAKTFNDQIRSLILRYELEPPEKPAMGFYSYSLDCLRSWEKTKKPETIRQIQSGVKKFNDFTNVKLSSISPDVLQKFVDHCYSLGNSTNTVWKSLKVVRTIVLKAYREGLITKNPFMVFEMPKYRNPEKTFLTKKQVEKIDKFAAKVKDEGLRIAGTWFVIGCYTGLRYGDMVEFKKTNIVDDRLIVYTAKTGQVVSMPVNNKLKELFSRVQYKPLPYVNVHANRLIKDICSALELPVVSWHCSRHTFGTLCAEAGISQEVTAKLMGHSDLKTTAIYYAITGTRIDSEIKKIF